MYKKWEPAGKPGSVVGNHSSGTAVTGGLLRPTRKRRGPRHRFPIWSCSRWGLPSHRVLPPARCALTAPFHPYRSDSCKPDRRYIFCCTFRRLTPPRGYLAPCPVEPGLSSPSRGWSDCLADSQAYYLTLKHPVIPDRRSRIRNPVAVAEMPGALQFASLRLNPGCCCADPG